MDFMFEVGDKVRVVFNRTMGTYGIPESTIEAANGEIYEIISAGEQSYAVGYRLRGLSFWWPEYMLQPEKIENQEEIHITRRGMKVEARYQKGNEVKCAKATCNPTDDFDFKTGVSIALERLFEEKGFTLNTFLEGKFAVHCPTQREAACFMALLSGRGVCWGTGERCSVNNSRWESFEKNTCYHSEKHLGEVTYCSYDYFKKNKNTIIKFADLDIMK